MTMPPFGMTVTGDSFASDETAAGAAASGAAGFSGNSAARATPINPRTTRIQNAILNQRNARANGRANDLKLNVGNRSGNRLASAGRLSGSAASMRFTSGAAAGEDAYSRERSRTDPSYHAPVIILNSKTPNEYTSEAGVGFAPLRHSGART